MSIEIRGHRTQRRLLALLACLALLAALTTIFSPAALGDSPGEECSSTDPAWNGEYWTVEEDDGVLDDIETNVSGATTLTGSGSWINNSVNPVFRVVLKIDDDDSDGGDTQVLTGFWETGQGGIVDLTLAGLEQVTFCFTDADADEEESTTTTTLGSTTTTSAPGTTTTSGSDAVTTPSVSTPTTGPTPGPSPTPETSPAPPPDEPTNAAAAGSTAGSVTGTSDPADESEAGGADGQTEGSTSEADPDMFAGPLMGGSGNPPVAGEAPISSQAEADPVGGSHPWPTLGDLAILGSLVSAIAAVMGRRRIGRFVKSLRWQE